MFYFKFDTNYLANNGAQRVLENRVQNFQMLNCPRNKTNGRKADDLRQNTKRPIFFARMPVAPVRMKSAREIGFRRKFQNKMGMTDRLFSFKRVLINSWASQKEVELCNITQPFFKYAQF